MTMNIHDRVEAMAADSKGMMHVSRLPGIMKRSHESVLISCNC